MLLPAVCAVCGTRGASPCGGCRASLRPAARFGPPPGVDACAALLDYAGVGRELVARLKYRNARASVRWLAAGMAGLVGSSHAWPVVTWVPTTAARRRARGFDHAEVLARAVARRLGVPCRGLLRRTGGGAQTGLSGPERRVGPSFAARRPVGGAVLLVDDVVTTGTTVAAAAAALRAAGARSVGVVAAARTRPAARADVLTRLRA